ncbi:MAG TPA: hypothetical protein VN688_23040 [Gemmataceae bacterium]|nr:hypothetical protein [Gemmataceae bacterium]
MTDLQYQEVLDNIAMFIDNPYALPWHVTPIYGNVQVQDSGQIAPGLTFVPTGRALNPFALQFQGSRQLQESWTVTPAVYNIKKYNYGYGGINGENEWTGPVLVLDDVRHAYQVVVGAKPAEKCLETYYRLGPGWYHVGKKKEVPKDACYVGRHCGTYVWVTREGLQGLGDTAVAILELTAIKINGSAGAYGAPYGAAGSPPSGLVAPIAPAVVPPPAIPRR